VLFASLIGTTIEFFDFYIFGMAAVLVFPKLFFPGSDPATSTLQSLATFSLAFFARPLGSAIFGHFGDRLGRKVTLVAALSTMGISTVVIGLLPTYQQVGLLAPVLLALCRFGQGFGLGGEWGGAVLLATENAPPGKRNWYGAFPQLGSPIGVFLSSGIFLVLTRTLDDQQFLTWGWRVPFVASAALVLVGLYIRLRIEETPAFRKAMANNERVRLPILTVLRVHGAEVFLGTFSAMATFVVFYLMTVFTLSWGTTKQGYARQDLLVLQMVGVAFFIATVALSGIWADRVTGRRALMAATVAVSLFGFLFAPLLASGSQMSLLLCLSLGLAIMGTTLGPLGAVLGDLFPTALRYTGASLTFNMAGIVGGSLTPYVATWLATHWGIQAVGWFFSIAGLISLAALVALGRLQAARKGTAI
jgi:metabolite-proton symporter